MIDLRKKIYTEHGYKVTRLTFNNNPEKAFPITGFVNISNKIKREMHWTKEGKQFLDKPSIWDLVEKETE